jgi:glycosyltransferase involved in cell wall biosynthesis
MNHSNLSHGPQPLISCLCVSSRRPENLRNTIRCYQAQTYSNRELIIVTTTGAEYRAVLDQFPDSTIKLFEMAGDEHFKLGDVRNHSITLASGEYICNWDDDDWSHPLRLVSQYSAAIQNHKRGSLLAYCLMHDSVNKRSYLSYPMFHPATVFCRKDVILDSVRYSSLDFDEDEDFITALYEKNALYAQVYPSLYIYVFHGGNTWAESHFKKLYSLSSEFSSEVSGLLEQIVSHTLSCEAGAAALDQPSIRMQFDYFKAFAMKHRASAVKA